MKRRMSTMVGMLATGAALMNGIPNLDKRMPRVNKMMSNLKPRRKRTVGSMMASGLLGFGLAYAIPKGKEMMQSKNMMQ